MKQPAGILLLSLMLCACESAERFSDIDECRKTEISISSRQLTGTDFSKLDQAPRANSDRQNLAKSYLEENCPQVELGKIPGSNQHNVICTLNPKAGDLIVVAAHYDKTNRGRGVVDNWSGIVILSRLLKDFSRLRSTNQLHYSLVFIAFGEEETGMHGASAWLRDWSDPEQVKTASNRNIELMVNLDTLGLGTLNIDRSSSTQPHCLAVTAAKALEIDFLARSQRNISGDWQAFKQKGISVLNLHSVDRRGIKVIHTRQDRIGALDLEKLNDAYRLSSTILEHYMRHPRPNNKSEPL